MFNEGAGSDALADQVLRIKPGETVPMKPTRRPT